MHEALCYDPSSAVRSLKQQNNTLTALDILDYGHPPQMVITGFRFLGLGE